MPRIRPKVNQTYFYERNPYPPPPSKLLSPSTFLKWLLDYLETKIFFAAQLPESLGILHNSALLIFDAKTSDTMRPAPPPPLPSPKKEI